MKLLVCLLCILLVAPFPAGADQGPFDQEIDALKGMVQELRETVQQQQATIAAQERRLRELEERPLAQIERALPGPEAVLQPSRGLQAFNPEIGVVADITTRLTQGSNDTEGNDKISVRELELIFGHDIDPYSRFDTTITFSDFETPSVEEAYITHWGLPLGLKGRLGRVRPKIGKANLVHRDQLDTVDEPLVIQNYLGIEGLFRTAAELSAFLPLPWESVTHEVTAGIMEGGIGEDGNLFGSTRRRPSFYSKLRNFWEISDTTNFELGGTYLVGSADADERFEVNAGVFDATFTHYVTPNNKLKFQNELFLQNRDETASGIQDEPWGAYSLVDYRFSPRFGIGGRFDYFQPVGNAATNPRDEDVAGNLYLTFYQSEFARWRAQYQHVESASGGNDDRFFLQGTVAIGVHKHQLQ